MNNNHLADYSYNNHQYRFFFSHILCIYLVYMVGWVHNGRVNGDLGVSRSIGDIKFKAFNEHTLQQPLLSKQHTLGSGNTDSGIHTR